MITFTKSTNPDQDRLIWIQTILRFWKFFWKFNFEKKSAEDHKSMKNYPAFRSVSIIRSMCVN